MYAHPRRENFRQAVQSRGELVRLCLQRRMSSRLRLLFVGFPCVYDGYKALEQRAWVRVTAKVNYKFHNIYRGKGPVLTALSVEPAEKPLNDVVTFS